MPTPREIEKLAEAMWQILDDMGKKSQSVCLLAKAEARIAFEPFRDKSEPEFEDWMSIAEAKQIALNVEDQR